MRFTTGTGNYMLVNGATDNDYGPYKDDDIQPLGNEGI